MKDCKGEPVTDAQPPVTLTPEALSEAERLATTEPLYHGRPLRIYLEGKGCDGFYYGVAFDELLPGDATFAQGALRLVIDADSLPFLEGSTVTWVDDERGRGFLVDNPQHRRFRGKFFKKKAWQARLTSSSQ
jgi:iron-sulfur cluster assembly accessory protein